MEYLYFVWPILFLPYLLIFLAQFNMEICKIFHPITGNRCVYVCLIVFGAFSGFPANVERIFFIA